MKSHNKIQFEKFHGNGNDFIFIENDLLESFLSIEQVKAFVKTICHRHFSIGADGIVFYKTSSLQNIQILIFNSDGSFASTCGNALRCLGLKLQKDSIWIPENPNQIEIFRLVPNFLSQEKKFLPKEESFLFSNASFATLLSEKDKSICVAMGKENEVLVTPLRDNALARFGKDLDFFTPIFIQLANPHWVFISPLFKTFDEKQFKEFGCFAQTELCKKTLSSEIPLCNISMVTLSEKNQKDWDLVVYERGAGLTQCCGSGATASRIALESVGLISKETPHVFFHMPGGIVSISKKEIAGHEQWLLQGQAEFVFSGTLL